MLRHGKERLDRRFFDHLPGIHHDHAVGHLGHHAEVMGDQHDCCRGLGAQRTHQGQHLRLDGDIERGGRLVGDQQRRLAQQRHGDHHPLAHAARHPVRIVVDALLGRRNAHAPQHFDRRASRLRHRQAAMAHQHLGQLCAHGEGRIKRGHRLLEDHRQPIAAQIGQRPRGQAKEVAAFESDGTRHAGRRAGHQAHDRQGGHAFAATRFADDAQGLAGSHGEAHTVNRTRRAARRVEGNPQVVDLEQHGQFAEALLIAASSIAASMTDRSKTPPGLSRVAKNFAKCTKRSRLTSSSRSSSASGSG